ncbi:MAG: hypothetical protein HUJ56_01365 [Erysipelotrichaceae bacterium]|nr:hypothetical protein [Erysipelotrichaceae bacterium]
MNKNTIEKYLNEANELRKLQRENYEKCGSELEATKERIKELDNLIYSAKKSGNVEDFRLYTSELATLTAEVEVKKVEYFNRYYCDMITEEERQKVYNDIDKLYSEELKKSVKAVSEALDKFMTLSNDFIKFEALYNECFMAYESCPQ